MLNYYYYFIRKLFTNCQSEEIVIKWRTTFKATFLAKYNFKGFCCFFYRFSKDSFFWAFVLEAWEENRVKVWITRMEPFELEWNTDILPWSSCVCPFWFKEFRNWPYYGSRHTHSRNFLLKAHLAMFFYNLYHSQTIARYVITVSGSR